jgi:hypothetical protein
MVRRYLQPLRSRGEAQHEPVLLFLDDRAHPLAWLALLLRAAYRHRSALIPVQVAGGLTVAAAVLHARLAPPAGIAIGTALVAGGACWPRVAPLLRQAERAYAGAVVLAAGTWLTAATITLARIMLHLAATALSGSSAGTSRWLRYRSPRPA